MRIHLQKCFGAKSETQLRFGMYSEMSWRVCQSRDYITRFLDSSKVLSSQIIPLAIVMGQRQEDSLYIFNFYDYIKKSQ
jgi:hypothetical protein